MTIKLKGSTDGSVSLTAPADTSPSGADITLTLPTDAGSANQFIKNSGTAGTLDYSSMVENSSGNVGFGTAAGAQRIKFSDSSDTVQGFINAQSDGTNGERVTIGTLNDAYLNFYTNANERVRIDSSGNVGINTTSPASFLHIDSDNAYGSIVLSRDGGTANRRPFGIGISGTLDNHLRISTSSDTTGANAFANQLIEITSEGKVGIGTTSPSQILELKAAEPRLCLNGTTADNQKGIEFEHNGTRYGSLFQNANSGEMCLSSGDNGSSYVITFKTDNAERMRISSSGRQTVFNGDAYNVVIRSSNSAGTSNHFLACTPGSSGIDNGGTGVSFQVFTNGNVQNTNNSYGAISDAKLKENIVSASSQWDDIKNLRVRNYNFIEGQTHTQIGVVAQEVETVSPGLVTESPDRDEDGNDLGTVTKSVNYSVLYMKSVKALQEAMERIETLETKVAALEAA